MCVCVCVIEYRILLSSFSNQLSRAFSPFCRGKQAWVCAGRPAGLPPCLLACLPACRLLHLCSLSLSLQKKGRCRNALRISLSLSLCADDVGLRAFLEGGSYLQENTYVFYILRIHRICTSISLININNMYCILLH